MTDGPHPSPTEILLASEGDLPASAQARVVAHLRTCPSCRRIIEDTDVVVADYGERLRAAEDAEPAVPGLREFQTRLIAVARESRERTSRIPTRVWLRLAALVPLTCLLVLSDRFVPMLKANELLERAAAAESKGLPEDVGVRIRVTTGGEPASTHGSEPTNAAARTERPQTLVVLRRLHQPVASNAALGEVKWSNTEREIAELFFRAGLDWDAPLSSSTFRVWRRALASKRDGVTQVGQEISIHTRTDEGLLREGTLLLDAVTLRAKRIRWRLASDARIDVEAVDRSLLPSEPESSRERAASPLPKASLAEVSAGKAELDHAEVVARAVLHRIGADLARELAITRTVPRHVTITGVVASAQMKERLAAELGTLPRVRLEITSADHATVAGMPSDAPMLISQRNARPALLAGWLEQHFPAVEAQQEYGSVALSSARAATAHSVALATLVGRYSPRELAQLAPADRQTVERLIQDHYTQLGIILSSLEQHLASVLDDVPVNASAPASDDELASVSTFVKRVRRIDRSVLELFADVEAMSTAQDQELPQVLATLRDDIRTSRQWIERIERTTPTSIVSR